MTAQKYAMPVAKLLTLGDPRGEAKWRDYLALGFKIEHVPELIRMAQDTELWLADSESKEVWANIHAWRTLGQLRAPKAIVPLLDLFQHIDDGGDDWVGEELPEVYALIGPAAVPALANYLADSSHGLWARIGASSSLQHIAEQHSQAFAECVAAIVHQLEHFAENDPALNGSLIADLLELKATGIASVIERAFAAKRVDESIVGDWEDVQIDLGLKKERSTPARSFWERLKDNRPAMLGTALLPEPWVTDLISQMTRKGELKPPNERRAQKKK
jgi:hypothetical protein